MEFLFSARVTEGECLDDCSIYLGFEFLPVFSDRVHTSSMYQLFNVQVHTSSMRTLIQEREKEIFRRGNCEKQEENEFQRNLIGEGRNVWILVRAVSLL